MATEVGDFGEERDLHRGRRCSHLPILWTVGIVLLVVGAVLLLLGSTGRHVGGRRHYS